MTNSINTAVFMIALFVFSVVALVCMGVMFLCWIEEKRLAYYGRKKI
jgi:hypothetical protein